MTKEMNNVQNDLLETKFDLSLDDMTDVVVDIDHSKLTEGMDFADRMEYFWNLSEE